MRYKSLGRVPSKPITNIWKEKQHDGILVIKENHLENLIQHHIFSYSKENMI